MNKYLNKFFIIGRLMYIFLFIDIIHRTRGDISSFVLFASIFLVVAINDHLRIYGYYKSIRYGYYLSLFVSAIISGIMAYFGMGYIDIYMFMVFYEINLYTGGKIGKLLFISDCFIIISVIILRQVSSFKELYNINFWRENAFDFIMILFFIVSYSFSLHAYKALYIEKTKVERLNKKLEQLSKEIEKLTITKERSRVAQEIHDYLGHNLSALNMNLDVAGKIVDKYPEKTEEIINKCQRLTKESMEGLREAVYALKEEDYSFNLKYSIEELIGNFSNTGSVNIIFNYNKKVDELLLNYKNTIYSIIREGLTNSIRHGQADEICIDTDIDDGFVNIILRDNGIGCSEIIKGNGLKGIEDRILSIDGRVDYITDVNEGFEIRANIPIKYEF